MCDAIFKTIRKVDPVMKKMTRLLAGVVAAMMMVTVPVALAEEEKPTIICHKANSIVIDGDLSDWDLSSPAVIDDVSQVIRDADHWQGANDCSMKVYTAYDETNLYLGFDVTEDSVYGAIDMLPVDGEDNLKIYLSTNPAADSARTAYETNDFLMYLIMYALRSFDFIVSLVGYTKSAAWTLPVWMYQEAFQKNNFAMAAAISCFLLALVLVLILPLTYWTNKRK